MCSLLIAVLAFLAVVQSAQAGAFSATALGKFNTFVKTPSAFPTAGPNTPLAYIHTGGRLDTRHVAYLPQAGYKSLLSIASYATNDTVYNGVTSDWPSSEYEQALAKSYGMEAALVPSSWTVESAEEISKVLSQLPSPVYIHCHVGFTAATMTQLHYYLNGLVSAEEIYSNGLNLGYDMQAVPDVVNVINAITGRNDPVLPEQIEQTLAEGEYSYKYYFWTHRLGNSDNWYNAGQILGAHTQAIVDAGYKTVMIFRTDGEPTSRLSTDPATGPVDNDEYSDEQGNYSVNLETAALIDAGINVVYLPLVGGAAETWSTEQFYHYLPAMKMAEAKGPILAHCASGYRSSAYVLTYIALQNQKCASWAVEQAKIVGFDLASPDSSSQDAEVIAMMEKVLGC